MPFLVALREHMCEMTGRGVVGMVVHDVFLMNLLHTREKKNDLVICWL